ncbi:hypothetical protein G3I60_19050 [Streptomyces sp. SID13666]|uniref:hypothetical protein n=1 Tax=unclassified Streptomyces TaxID=2593676 RepID=UPI001106923D|nr:hypothetical protein [Streptomyces sp. H39-C1]MCZ4096820.1 hypothetical protein [Streptomyces sp. H39-C1]NEA56190.1 hypothetical protein [Streptomyces sp. SID13666]NEA71861.1 hypothetical protein [Streptomyces sp. SID13588]QNA77096.1 hypothetical protein C8250_039275 [Streptomyces sp. So13.3]
MPRRHHFHLDHLGHSITVNIRSGVSRDVEVLVDGKEVAHQRVRAGSSVLTAELPEDPAQPFQIRIHQPRFGSSVPQCVLSLDDVDRTMPPRLVA